MATHKGKPGFSGRIRLDGDDDTREKPAMSIHAVGDDGEVLATAPVADDGAFSLDETALAKARRVVVTARDAKPGTDAASFVVRPDVLRRGDIVIGPARWAPFFTVTKCVDANIRRCFPWHSVVTDLISQAEGLPLAAQASDALQLFHPVGCAPICEGWVDVYRRTCCCRPIIFDPPILVDPPFKFPHDFRPPWPPFKPFPPVPPVPPGPGPDPAPFALQDQILTEGALDLAKVTARRQVSMSTHAQIAFSRCRCGPPVKVATGFVGEGGDIHICWSEPLRLMSRLCHDEYAFVVSQNIGGATVTIYNGLAAGQWFDAGDDDIQLTSYHYRAIGCREDDFPVPVGGAFVILQDLGGTESHQLRTPLPDSADSVLTPNANSGLLDVDSGPDYALGGNVYLRYHFSEVAGASMKALGAKYFRVQWAPANALGDPTGDWETLPVPAWKTWRIVGADIVPGSHALGPNSAGAFSDLYSIPFETGAPLVNMEEWQDGQFHAYVPTDQKPEGRYLVRMEVFNAAGVRLTPGSSPFTYRRWNTPTTTLAVNFGALTHLIRTDNRPVVADIVDVVGPGADAGDCKFFVGNPTDLVTVQYRAYHPQAGAPSFMLGYSLAVRRGISGSPASTISSAVEVGEGPSAAGHSISLATLLDGEDKCSFATTLYVSARIHNGSGRLSHLDRSDVAAFAVELA